DCSNAVIITPTFTSCNFQAGSSANATESLPTCSGGGNADDDVWYQFVANSTNMTITVDPTTGYDAVIQLFSGTCGSLTSIQCEDLNGPNGDEVLNNQSLTIGNTYYVRVYHYGTGWGTATFNICVTGLAPPNNDTPCSAYPLPVVTPSCNFEIYTNFGAGNSAVPTPSACGGSSPFDGGYLGGDVWFSVIVPASGELDIHTLSVDFADGAMALYSGACGALTLVECDDDGEPGDGILMPHIYATGLTPGATMYIRVWEYDNNANGQFGICVATPDNDNCASAQEICDLNGYGGVTSSAYTQDFPSNMTGTGQNGVPNSNPTAPFGQGYGGASPVQIDNNSWLTFTADATTAELFVQVNYCSNGNGMQMQIFSGTNCTNFTAVSTFLETTNSQTITATGLIPGNQYYIMVDGFAGDICSYTISATSGIQVVKITTAKEALCLGDTAVLDAEVTGAGSYTYSWSSTPPGFTSSAPSVSVVPSQNTLYNVDITGVCGNITSASLYVTVNDYPTVNVTASDTFVCLNDVINLNGNPNGGSMPYNHSWTGTGQLALNSSAIQTPNFSTSTAGNYSLIYEVTDTVGCSTIDSVSVTVNDLPTATITGIDSICIGDTTTLTASGGVSYLWNTTSILDSIVVNPSSDTNYSVTVTDNNNCQNSTNIDVFVNPLPTPSISGTNVICEGESTTLTANGGISYVWNNGAITPFINVSPTADTTYVVTATNSSGCSDTTSITVQVKTQPTASIIGIDTVCFGNSSTLFASGGGTYTWNNGTSLDSVVTNPLSDSTFSVIVDVNGCLDTAYYDVIVNALPIASISGTDTICTGEFTTLTASGGSTYVWNDSSTLDSIVANPTSDTNYSVTVTDNNNCENTANIDVVVNPLPSPSISGSNVICSGTSTTLTANGGNSYVWNNGATTPSITVSPSTDSTYLVTATNPSGCSDTTSILVQVVSNPSGLITSSEGSNFLCEGNTTTLSASGGGTYTWNTGETTDSIIVSPALDSTYSVIVDAGGCLDTAYFSITVNSLPTVTFSGDSVICNGESTTLFASGGTSYLWNNGSTNDSIVVNPAADSTYSVTVIDANNCSNSGNINVVVNALPSPSISGSNVICSGNSTTLTASGGNSYVWNNGATTPSITVSPSLDSTYLVTATNSNGCSDTTSILVQVVSNPSGLITSSNGSNFLCEGNTTTLSASGGGTYTWNTGESTDSIMVSPALDSTYSVIVNTGGCLDTAYFSITVNTLPSVSFSGDSVICNGESTTLTASGGTAYLWSTSSNSNTITVSPTNTTNYSVIVTDANNCENTGSITVTVNSLPNVTISGTDSICEGSSTALTATGASSYVWNTTETTPSIDVTPSSNTSYSVEGTDVNGCMNNSQVTVSILPKPIATITGDNNMCDGADLILQASGGSSYVWNTTETTSSITVSPSDTTTYQVIAFINSCADTTTHTVNWVPNPTVTAFSDALIHLGQSIDISASGDAPFLWTPTESLSCNNCPNPTATPTETTEYCVSVTQNNCTSTSCILIEVDQECGEIFVPDAFSPNNDGNNDCLKVYNNCLDELLFRVYSRWGELLFESTDIDACWDGTHNGTALNTGVYAYTVKVILVNGDEVEVKGNVTLFR
ncbi:MAG: gliding motility-associated C-terminal domain-containing protein, partial [Flavobacteriales bacterium]|nr:gliding motility-associated C-terminal domain-containing protein [Flavobacteriales bacterium]